MKNHIDSDLIAPCGMNCSICVGFFGYAVNGRKRKIKCIGCRPRNKNCAFIIKKCEKLSNNEINFCYECSDFPCENLKKLDKRYREKYNMSMIENLKYIEKYGINKFLKNERKRWECPNCGEIICVHTKKCYFCENN